MANYFKKLNTRPPASTSSGKWRRFYWPKVLAELSKQGFKEAQFREVFELTFAVLNTKNMEILNKLLDERDIRGLSKIIHKLPEDFEDVNYDLIRVVYIETDTCCYLGLFKVIQYKKTELIRLDRIENIDVKLFVNRALIYPI